MWRSALVLVAMVQLAHADSVRTERRFSVGLAFPDEMYIMDDEPTVPLPALHFGYAISSVVSIEASAGYVPMEYKSHQAIGDLGVRFRLTEHAFAPFVMARMGVLDIDPDEGTAGTFPFVLGGAGLEYVGGSGIGFWLDIGAGVIRYSDGPAPSTNTAAFGGGLGVAYHF